MDTEFDDALFKKFDEFTDAMKSSVKKVYEDIVLQVNKRKNPRMVQDLYDF